MSRSFLSVLLAFSTVSSAAAADSASKPPTKQECVAANESGQDLRRSGHLHDARTNLALCLSTSCPRPVREDCAQRLAEVEAAMPTVVFVAKDSSSNDLSNVRVSVDGRRFLDKLEGAAIAIDPGEHHFRFEADGFHRIDTTVILREGDKKRRIMAFLDPVVAEPPPAPLPGSAPPATTPVKVPPPSDSSDSSSSDGRTQRTIGLVLGGTGVAWLLVGGAFGIAAKVTYDDHAKTECAGGCPPQGRQDLQAAQGQATVSNIAFATGGALLMSGAILYFTAPSRSTTTMAIGPTFLNGGAGLSMKGEW